MKIEVVETIDVNTRWEQGIKHDPRSVEIVKWIAEYDFKFCSDYFCWKTGGDGDNGETLMYELDEYFAAKDKETKNESNLKVVGDDMDKSINDIDTTYSHNAVDICIDELDKEAIND